MEVTDHTIAPDGRDGPPGPRSSPVAEPDVRRLAETFGVTPEAIRMAVARVGTDFRQVQRELGGRR
jgi:hypothetical protein